MAPFWNWLFSIDWKAVAPILVTIAGLFYPSLREERLERRKLKEALLKKREEDADRCKIIEESLKDMSFSVNTIRTHIVSSKVYYEEAKRTKNYAKFEVALDNLVEEAKNPEPWNSYIEILDQKEEKV